MNWQKLYKKTPLYHSLPLSYEANKNIWLKMECFQPTYSFKIRGIGRLAQNWVTQGYRHLVSSSGGNAGLAVAFAGRQLGVKVSVFLPETSSPIFINALKLMGTDIHLGGRVWDEAHEKAMQFCTEKDAAYVHPFDHPLIWAGHATMIHEVAQQGLKPDAVIVSVGGGGLACGVLQGLADMGWTDVQVITAETEGADSFAQSVDQDELVTLSEISSIATSLGARRVTEQLWLWRKRHNIQPLVVSDAAAVQACLHFADEHRILVEPACGASLAILKEYENALAAFSNVLVIVCGGFGATLKTLTDFAKRLGIEN